MGKLQVAPGDNVAGAVGSKAEEISLLVDGELDAVHVESVCTHLRDAGSMVTWVCYHVIGDTLRGASATMPGFADRFSMRLSSEPTVLAPQARRTAPAAIAWAAAATIAVHQEYSPTTAIQGARPYLRAVAATDPDARP